MRLKYEEQKKKKKKEKKQKQNKTKLENNITWNDNLTQAYIYYMLF